MRIPTPQGLLKRFLVGTFLVQFFAVASLMVTDRLRRVFRGKGVETLPRVPGYEFEVGGDHDVTVYVSGAVLFEDMIAAIDAAQHRVLFESYIIKGDDVGQRFKTALIAAADRGVDVHVIYDAFANLVVPSSFFDFPPSVHVLRYPMFPSGANPLSPRAWGRDHRKILVVDDSVGFVGGYNIGDSYEDEWRDTHVAVRGSAVWDLENAFIDFWNSLRPDVHLQPMATASWDPHIRAHRNVPAQLIFPIRGMYLEAIDRATTSIDITQAYFIPDHNILQALIDAAQRGVTVRLLVPKVSNHVLADWVARGFFTRMLEAGVQIWRYTDHMVHAKTMTVDGEWTTIGTANIDRLSLTGNYEIGLEVLDASLAQGMVRIFESDLGSAQRLTLEEWRGRTSLARVYERVLRLWRPLL